MRYLILSAALLSGCSNLVTPTSASEPEVTDIWGHGMTISLPDPMNVGFVCKTQPRMYSDNKYVVDKYLSYVPCPDIPIP